MARLTTLLRCCSAALTLLILAASPALALDAHWHGVRSDFWNDGIDGGVSNWYSKRPPNGQPRDVPDGTAYFSVGAVTYDVTVAHPTTIEFMQFEPTTPTYIIEVQSPLNVTGDGVAGYAVFRIKRNMSFFGRSDTGALTDYVIRKSGLLDLTSTRGVDAKRVLYAKKVQNSGRIFLGSNKLRLRTFRQSASGLTKLRVTNDYVGRIVAENITLSGELKVLGRTSVTPGKYLLIRASTQRTGTFDKATFIGFANGLTTKIRYDGNDVFLVVK